MTAGEALVRLRYQQGNASQELLSKATKIPVKKIKAYEEGKGSLNFFQQRAIAKAMGVHTDWIKGKILIPTCEEWDRMDKNLKRTYKKLRPLSAAGVEHFWKLWNLWMTEICRAKK